KAVILGLLGETPDEVVVEDIEATVARVRKSASLKLLKRQDITFGPDDLLFLRKTLPYHPNGMRLVALDGAGNTLRARAYYSVGGGFVVDEEAAEGQDPLKVDATPVRHPFHSAAELLGICKQHGLRISDVMLENEKAFRPEADTRAGLLR